jgi:hypothetical protein
MKVIFRFAGDADAWDEEPIFGLNWTRGTAFYMKSPALKTVCSMSWLTS